MDRPSTRWIVVLAEFPSVLEKVAQGGGGVESMVGSSCSMVALGFDQGSLEPHDVGNPTQR